MNLRDDVYAYTVVDHHRNLLYLGISGANSAWTYHASMNT